MTLPVEQRLERLRGSLPPRSLARAESNALLEIPNALDCGP